MYIYICKAYGEEEKTVRNGSDNGLNVYEKEKYSNKLYIGRKENSMLCMCMKERRE